MNIYKLMHATDSNIIGVYPHIQSYIQPYQLFGSKSYRQVERGKRTELQVEFPIFKMEHRAKRNDFIVCAPFGNQFIVFSPKASTILKSELIFDENETFTIEVKHRKEIIEYQAIHITKSRVIEYTDWLNSVFTLYGDYIDESGIKPMLNDITFKNYEEYLKAIRTPNPIGSAIGCKKLNLIDDIPFDLFYYPLGLGNSYLCSEKFKEVVEKNGLTGFRFVPFESNEV